MSVERTSTSTVSLVSEQSRKLPYLRLVPLCKGLKFGVGKKKSLSFLVYLPSVVQPLCSECEQMSAFERFSTEQVLISRSFPDIAMMANPELQVKTSNRRPAARLRLIWCEMETQRKQSKWRSASIPTSVVIPISISTGGCFVAAMSTNQDPPQSMMAVGNTYLRRPSIQSRPFYQTRIVYDLSPLRAVFECD